MTNEYNSQVAHDAILGEAIATPVSLMLLVLIFGGLAAAAIPVSCGLLTVFGSLAALRLMSEVGSVSAFAFNMSMVIGLALAIDYGLFTVSRFREELRTNPDVATAVQRTIRTAGRTILFSGCLMMCAFAGMIAIPVPMIQSLALGAAGAVAIAVLLAVTAVPAALAILGPRVNALSWRKDVVQRSEARAQRLWGGLADWVIPRAIPVSLVITSLLLLASVPAFGLRPAAIDASGLPAHSPTRAAQMTLQAEFPSASAGADLIVQSINGSAPSDAHVSQIVTAARKIDGVRIVARTAQGQGFQLLHAVLAPQDFTVDTWRIIRELRNITPPSGTTILVGGDNAVIADSNSAVVRSFPLMLLIMIGSTLVLMTIAFRSVVLPIKAVLMAAISLTATFGLLTWVVQNGHAAWLFGIEPGPLPFPALVLVVAVVFGLSTDYEVFLVSRMVEARRQGSDTPQAVRTGLVQTGRVITAAAFVMITVVGATAWSHVALARIAGLGMGIAIFIDAAIVRTLLVPSLVTFMGKLNWWMPKVPFRRTRPGAGIPEPARSREPR
jgi:RND superfamily putative drug exporter